MGKTKRGKGTKWMVVVDGQGLPLGNQLYAASPHEVGLAEATLAAIRVPARGRGGRPRQKPARVIADRGYDSDPLRWRLARRKIELIAPHRLNRRKPPRMVGRCAVTEGAGSSSAPSPGWATTAGWSCATTARSPSTKRFSISPAS